MESEGGVSNAALSLNRKLHPSKINDNVEALLSLVTDEDTQDEVAQRIDQPLTSTRDTQES